MLQSYLTTHVFCTGIMPPYFQYFVQWFLTNKQNLPFQALLILLLLQTLSLLQGPALTM